MRGLTKFSIVVGLGVAPSLLGNNVDALRFNPYDGGVGGGEYTVVPLAGGVPDLTSALAAMCRLPLSLEGF